jgi:hypothetical protein
MGSFSFAEKEGAKWHNGASYENKENAKDIAHRMKYFRM